MHDHPFTMGTPVYTTAGAKVGTLRAHNPQTGYLTVRTGGHFRGKDLFIPVDVVSRSDAAGVTLQLSKDDLRGDRYAFPYPRITHPHMDKGPNTPSAPDTAGSGTPLETPAPSTASRSAPSFSSLD